MTIDRKLSEYSLLVTPEQLDSLGLRSKESTYTKWTELKKKFGICYHYEMSVTSDDYGYHKYFFDDQESMTKFMMLI